jgi:hypothetical protein
VWCDYFNQKFPPTPPEAPLDQADQGKTQLIEMIVAQEVERSLSIYLKTISKSTAKNESLPLSVLAQKTKYSVKYLSLLARTGELNAHKIGRNWQTSLDAIDAYEKTRHRKRMFVTPI